MNWLRKFYVWMVPALLLVFICTGVNYSDSEDKTFIYRVQYIATEKEKKEFEKLETEKEKKKFIEEFWKKRDPTPSTEVNEFKKQFKRRKKEANKQFRGEAKTGWKTDRGKIYILLGKPDERREKPFMGTETSKTGDMGADRDYSIREWTYYNLPTEYGLGPQVKIEFVDRGWNRVRLKSRLDYNIEIAKGVETASQVANVVESVAPADVGDVTQAQKGAKESPKKKKLSPQQIIENLLTEKQSRENFDFKDRMYYFKTKKENKTRSYITVGIKPSDISEKESESDIYAGAFLEKKGAKKKAESTGSSASKKSSGLKKIPKFLEYKGNKDFSRDDYHLFQIDVGLEPGKWILKLAIYDKISGEKALKIRELDVPSYDKRPELSSFVLLKDYQKLEKNTEGKTRRFFTVENIQLIPELDDTLIKGEQSLQVYYQIYNSEDGNLKKYNRHIRLRIKRPSDEKYKLISGYPQSFLNKRNNVGAFGFNTKELTRFPAAGYELQVDVVDSEDKTKKDSEKLRYILKGKNNKNKD